MVMEWGRVIGFAAVTASGGAAYPSLVMSHPEYQPKGLEDLNLDSEKEPLQRKFMKRPA
ncbi:hypothetical protein V1502_03160 [Bacillus sp. SCS-153A]|uniref:hypothetical protein n=1 Tax=Rossellomorea sedimentorum TaxID=3115294 RepID=UPI003906AB4B